MARQFLPVDRDAPALLPVNMLDWVPKDHVVRLVIATVEEVASPELIARLVPAVRSVKGRRRYDPVMLLILLMYSYMRGVLTVRAIEDRCRYDVTFRVACGKHVPDHVTISGSGSGRSGRKAWQRNCFTGCFSCARPRGWGG